MPLQLAVLKEREEAFRIHTNAWIKMKDEAIRKIAETEVAKKNKPIRHPKGVQHDRFDREHMWADWIWCQDISDEPFILFFAPSQEEMDEMMQCQGCNHKENKIDPETGKPYWTDQVCEYGEIAEWLMTIFNEEFVKVCPDLKHVLEA